jgi:hypothetical protein
MTSWARAVGFLCQSDLQNVARPARLRNRNGCFGEAQTLTRHPAVARLRSVASGGGWRARQDSNLRPPA